MSHEPEPFTEGEIVTSGAYITCTVKVRLAQARQLAARLRELGFEAAAHSFEWGCPFTIDLSEEALIDALRRAEDYRRRLQRVREAAERESG